MSPLILMILLFTPEGCEIKPVEIEGEVLICMFCYEPQIQQPIINCPNRINLSIKGEA